MAVNAVSGKVYGYRHNFKAFFQSVFLVHTNLCKYMLIKPADKSVLLKQRHKIPGYYHSSVCFYPADKSFGRYNFACLTVHLGLKIRDKLICLYGIVKVIFKSLVFNKLIADFIGVIGKHIIIIVFYARCRHCGTVAKN